MKDSKVEALEAAVEKAEDAMYKAEDSCDKADAARDKAEYDWAYDMLCEAKDAWYKARKELEEYINEGQ